VVAWLIVTDLGQQIREEEEKFADLDGTVTNWIRAKQYREFISALERSWASAGKDISTVTENGKR
jgi:hypothetical protein